jgi:hypothetical protein
LFWQADDGIAASAAPNQGFLTPTAPNDIPVAEGHFKPFGDDGPFLVDELDFSDADAAIKPFPAPVLSVDSATSPIVAGVGVATFGVDAAALTDLVETQSIGTSPLSMALAASPAVVSPVTPPPLRTPDALIARLRDENSALRFGNEVLIQKVMMKL